jgi:hypothetical protein
VPWELYLLYHGGAGKLGADVDVGESEGTAVPRLGNLGAEAGLDSQCAARGVARAGSATAFSCGRRCSRTGGIISRATSCGWRLGRRALLTVWWSSRCSECESGKWLLERWRVCWRLRLGLRSREITATWNVHGGKARSLRNFYAALKRRSSTVLTLRVAFCMVVPEAYGRTMTSLG